MIRDTEIDAIKLLLSMGFTTFNTQGFTEFNKGKLTTTMFTNNYTMVLTGRNNRVLTVPFNVENVKIRLRQQGCNA